MPTITLNKTVLEKLVGKKLPIEELKERISMLGTNLEKIDDDEIEVEIFPNRPDLLSEPGFARAFSSFIGVKTGLRKYEVTASGEKIIIDSSVKDIRPYTACAIIKNLSFDEEKIREIIQIQEKLHITYGRNRKKVAIGIYPLEKISFPVTYKADAPEKIKFRPLESAEEMTGLQILSRHKTGREFGPLLEGLAKFPFFVDTKGAILSMPPIINSQLTGRITAETKEIFIECSGFDYQVLSKGINMIVAALADLGGKIYSLKLAYPEGEKISPNLTPEKMKLDLNYINNRLGLQLSKKEGLKLLEKMGYGYEKGEILIPAYRTDLLHQADLAEDMAIAYGYENFIEEIPKVATIGQEDPLEKFLNKLREVLIGFGLWEVKNYHLITAEELNQKMLLGLELIPLHNALGDYDHLRNSLLPCLMKNLSDNQHNEYPQNFFELGRVFSRDKNTETGFREKEHLAVVLCHEKTDFTEIKQILDALMNALGLESSIKESGEVSFIAGRVGDILIAGKKIGSVGELHPQVITNWGLAVPVVGLELDAQELFKLIYLPK